MAQFDIHRNLNPATRKVFPYLLNVQSDLLDVLATRTVIPLIRKMELERPIKGLTPQFRIQGKELLMDTPEIAGVPKKILGDVVASAANRRSEIIAALDLLILGV